MVEQAVKICENRFLVICLTNKLNLVCRVAAKIFVGKKNT